MRLELRHPSCAHAPCIFHCAPGHPAHGASSLQAGFATITALFILVTLALLGAYAAGTASMQHSSSVLDVSGTQAYQAANAGIEWGLASLKAEGPSACTAIGSATSFAVDEFTVTLSCSKPAEHLEAGDDNIAYQLEAIACNAASCPGSATEVGNPYYIERNQLVTASFCWNGSGPC